jgi:hypothetical protein
MRGLLFDEISLTVNWHVSRLGALREARLKAWFIWKAIVEQSKNALKAPRMNLDWIMMRHVHSMAGIIMCRCSCLHSPYWWPFVDE